METKTAAELVALVVREIREHPEYDHIADVSVMPRIPQPLHPANWHVELSVCGSWHIPEGAYKIVERLQAQFNLACSDFRLARLLVVLRDGARADAGGLVRAGIGAH
jgi:hypothetical protein